MSNVHISLNEAQLQALFDRMAKASLESTQKLTEEALQAVKDSIPIAVANTGTQHHTFPKSTKDLKLTDPPAFTGKPDDLERVIRDCEVRFTIQNDMFNTPTKKAYYILTLFKEGAALLWKNVYIEQ